MAQQASNTQREPSMDEILASIRRIIEESEPDRASVDLSAIEQLAGGPGPAANDPEIGAPAGTAEKAEQPFAQDRGLHLENADDRQVNTASADAFDAEHFAIDPELESAFRQMEDMPIRGQVETEAAASYEAAAPYAEIAEPRREPVVDAVSGTAMDRPKSIISEQAGRQVAASFGELADAFAASRRRSFDEVAEEMMRPMLQEWMDNNLPTLVERLVREEIERVARGS